MQSFVQGMQNNNKCPHGFPIGSCPICSGMGSRASSNRNKPRKQGEMSYNECLAQWNRMKALKQTKLNAKNRAILNQQNNKPNKNFSFNKNSINLLNFLKNLNPLKLLESSTANRIISFSKNILQNSINIIQNAISTIGNIIKGTISNLFNNTFSFLNSISEKLSSLLGETKNFFNNKIEKSIKRALDKTIKTILSLFTQENKEEESEKG